MKASNCPTSSRCIFFFKLKTEVASVLNVRKHHVKGNHNDTGRSAVDIITLATRHNI